jgi:hypothetical protein
MQLKIQDIHTHAWEAMLECGTVLTGKEEGSFLKVKDRKGIIDLWVETPQGKVFAHKQTDREPIGFHFFVHTKVDLDNPVPVKHFKLLTYYPDKTFIKHVFPDGSSILEKQ